MAVKSIIDIDVNDTRFTKFTAAFAKYQELLAKTPAIWAAADKEASGSAKTFDRLAAALLAQREVTRQISAEQAAISRAAAAQAKVWSDFRQQWRDIAGYVASATRSLLRWGSIAGVASGLLGIGGLYGIDRLATSAGNQRRSALGLGLSPGQERGFAATYGRLTDPSQLLGAVNEALHDVTKRVGLYGAGLSESDIRGRDTGQVAEDLIPALKKIADRTPENMLAQVLRARHLDQFITLEDFERIKHTPASEIAGYQQQYQSARRAVELTQQQQKAWQDLQVQLHLSGLSIEATFIRGLTPLAPKLKELSATFTTLIGHLLEKDGPITRWISELGDGLEWLSTTISKPEFEQNVTDFLTRIGVLASEVGTVIDGLARAVVWISKWFPASSKDFQDDPSIGLYHEGGPTSGYRQPRPGTESAPNGVPRPGPTFGPQYLPGGASHSAFVIGGESASVAEAHDFFRAAGWTEAQTAGILGNINAESGFNPRSLNASGHQGLAQWDRNRSATFRRMFGHDPIQGTFEEQLLFIEWELENTEKATGDQLRKYGTTPGTSADIINRGYERSGVGSGSRAGAADQYMQQFKDRSVQVVIKNQTGGNAIVSASQLATT